jgi:hypothetical protein
MSLSAKWLQWFSFISLCIVGTVGLFYYQSLRFDYEAKHNAEQAAKRSALEAMREYKDEATVRDPSSKPISKSEEKRRSADDHYIQGINYFQNGDYEKARKEWHLCNHLDPSNADCAAGLQRVDQRVNGP